MVKAILFDLDGTLFDRDAAVRALLVDQYVRWSSVLGEIPGDRYVGRVLDLDAHGHGDKAAVYQQIAEEFGLPSPLAGTLAADFWDEYHSFCRSDVEVRAALRALRGRGLKLGVITNGAVRIQEPVIARLELAELFEVVLISEREGVRKPDREIFERALRHVGLLPEEVWFVGDHPVVDIAGAAAAGMSPVWKRTSYWPAPDIPCRQIDRITELVGLAEKDEASMGPG